jgi:hypothetical protein
LLARRTGKKMVGLLQELLNKGAAKKEVIGLLEMQRQPSDSLRPYPLIFGLLGRLLGEDTLLIIARPTHWQLKVEKNWPSC